MAKTPRTAEQCARTSEAIKKWWANRTEEQLLATRRKMSATRQERSEKTPARAKRDSHKATSESNKRYYRTTYLGHENKLYIGYLSRKDILECPPEKRKKIVKKKSEGMKRAWASYTPEQLRERSRQASIKTTEAYDKVRSLYEFDVSREPIHCGVVEMECMNG